MCGAGVEESGHLVTSFTVDLFLPSCTHLHHYICLGMCFPLSLFYLFFFHRLVVCRLYNTVLFFLDVLVMLGLVSEPKGLGS